MDLDISAFKKDFLSGAFFSCFTPVPLSQTITSDIIGAFSLGDKKLKFLGFFGWETLKIRIIFTTERGDF